jgi:hypothetical protein
MLNITVNDDLTSDSTNGELRLLLTNTNPMTLQMFANKEDVEQFVNQNFYSLAMSLEAFEPKPTPVVIPQSITPRQARLKLLEVGLLDDLEAVITTNRAWQIEWEYATEVKRDSPLIDAVASEASLTSDQIDQMFIEASTL